MENAKFISPIGIIVCYAVLLEGASGETADQIMYTLHLSPTFENIEKIRNEIVKVRMNQYACEVIP